MNNRISLHRIRRERRRRIFNLLYPSLIVFYIFTFSETIFNLFNEQCSDINHYIEAVLLFAVWIILAIHIFSAYTRVYEISQRVYPLLTFILDCVEILFAMVLIACVKDVIQSHESGPYDYTNIYVVMLLLTLNQVVWFVSIKMRDTNAMIRLGAMLITIIALIIWENNSVSILNHAIFISLFALMAILTLFDKRRLNR